MREHVFLNLARPWPRKRGPCHPLSIYQYTCDEALDHRVDMLIDGSCRCGAIEGVEMDAADALLYE